MDGYMVDAMMMYRGMLLINTFYPDSEFPWRVFLRPCSQVPRAAAGVPLQRGGAAQPDQERAAAARQPQLLRQLRQHHRQQDHGGLSCHCQDVRDSQDRVRRLQNRPGVLQLCSGNGSQPTETGRDSAEIQ